MARFLVLLVASAQIATSAIASEAVSSNFSIKVAAVKNVYGIVYSTMIVENRNDFAIADIGLICVAYAASGTELHLYNLKIFQIFAPRSVRKVENFKIGFMPDQGKSIACTDTVARKG